MYNNTICHNIVSLLKQPSCLWSPSPSSLYLMKGVFKMSSWNGPIKCLLHIPFIFSLTSIGQLCGVDCWETDSVGATSPCYYDNFHFSVLLSCFCYWSRSSLRGTRGTSLESGRLQSLKRKKRDNKESSKKKKPWLLLFPHMLSSSPLVFSQLASTVSLEVILSLKLISHWLKSIGGKEDIEQTTCSYNWGILQTKTKNFMQKWQYSGSIFLNLMYQR